MKTGMDRLKYVPVEKATTPPPDLIKHYKNHWWVCHPEKGLAFFDGKFAQCNTNEKIVRNMIDNYPGTEARFIPSAFFPINPQDYC